MKKFLAILLLVSLISLIFASITFAGVDTVPTYTAGRIIILYPGAQVALQTGNVNYLLTGKTDGMRVYVGRDASVYGIIYTSQGLQYIDVYSYKILQ